MRPPFSQSSGMKMKKKLRSIPAAYLADRNVRRDSRKNGDDVIKACMANMLFFILHISKYLCNGQKQSKCDVFGQKSSSVVFPDKALKVLRFRTKKRKCGIS